MDETKMVDIDLSKLVGSRDAKFFDLLNVDLNDYLEEGWKVCDGRLGTEDLADKFQFGDNSNIIVYAQKV